jgi:hypothetical protein
VSNLSFQGNGFQLQAFTRELNFDATVREGNLNVHLEAEIAQASINESAGDSAGNNDGSGLNGLLNQLQSIQQGFDSLIQEGFGDASTNGGATTGANSLTAPQGNSNDQLKVAVDQSFQELAKLLTQLSSSGTQSNTTTDNHGVNQTAS